MNQEKKKMPRRRILSFMLALCMIMAAFPATSLWAAEDQTESANVTMSEDADDAMDAVDKNKNTDEIEAVSETVGETPVDPEEKSNTYDDAGETENPDAINNPENVLNKIDVAPNENDPPEPKASNGTMSGNCGIDGGDNIKWRLDPDGEYYKLTISGTGRMEEYTVTYPSPPNTPWVESRGLIKTIVIENGVTSIGDFAFDGCSSLMEVNISSSVTRIGNYAFDGCISLINIDIPSNVTGIANGVFRHCSSLTDIDIPSSMTEIGDWFFYGCSSLTGVNIPNNVTRIGKYVFEDCSSLTSINIPNSMTEIEYSAFAGCSSLTSINIPNSVIGIGKRAFYGCSSLTSVTILGSIISIGEDVFSHCSSLADIVIPNSITSIGNYAFSYCSSLADITLPSSMTSIGHQAFSSSGLTSINIPDGVTSIANGAFSGCENLVSVTLPSSVTSIEQGVFNGCISLTNINIPSGVTSIGSNVFYRCSGLTKIIIPNSVTSIGSDAFAYSGLIRIVIPNSVTSIGRSAFEGCGSLSKITLPNSVTSIGSDAFAYSGLIRIVIPNSVTSIEEDTFCGCESLTRIIIPDSVASIGVGAFSWCNNLTSITLPNSVTNIGYHSFYLCKSLKNIYYDGDENSWKAMKDSYGFYPAGNHNYIVDNTTTDGYFRITSSHSAKIHYNGSKSDTDTPTFKDVYYYDTIAGVGVNVDLFWNWNDLLEGDSYEYSPRLAKMGIVLSAAMEGTNFKDEAHRILIGNDKEIRLGCDNVKYIESTSPDMAVGIKTIKAGEDTKYIIFVVLRGTSTWGDGLNDVLSHLKITHWGISPVSKKLNECLEDWRKTYGKIDGNNTKFFVTGHSLGGACANLLSADLSKEYGEENVFGYTFAAPSPLDKMEDVLKFRGNIYNFLCVHDYVPSHFRRRDTWYGYGYPRWFDMFEQSEKTQSIYSELTGKQWADTHNENYRSIGLHTPSIYTAYLIADPYLQYSGVSNYVRIKCPVDVEVYDSNNELIGRIVNDEIDYSYYSPDVEFIVCDGAKYVYFLNDDTYTVKLTSTGEGSMTYTVASKDMNEGVDEETKTYSDIKLSVGKKFSSSISSYDMTGIDNPVKIPDVELLVTDDNGKAIAQVLSDTEASASGKDNGTEVPIGTASVIPSPSVSGTPSVPGSPSSPGVPSVPGIEPSITESPTVTPPSITETPVVTPTITPGTGTETPTASPTPPVTTIVPSITPTPTNAPTPGGNIGNGVMLKKLKITGSSKRIAVGKKLKLKATISPANATNKAVTWKTSNNKYATVNSKGIVTIKKVAGGKAVTITATAKDGSGIKASYKIQCMKGIVKKVTISGKKTRTIKAGKSIKLKAKVKATKGANKTLKWSSSNTKYAKVNNKGKVTTKKAGKGKTVKITAAATDGSGKKATVKIKIN